MAKRSIDPVVSTEWLEARIGAKGEARGADGLTVIDIRDEEDYAAGHIPGAISVPFSPVSEWSDCTDELLLELPPKDDLLKTIGDCGLSRDSRVVIVGRLPVGGEPPYPLADPMRVAATLMYAGVGNVAVLSGGHAKWTEEGRTIVDDPSKPQAVAYDSAVDDSTWVSTDYVEQRIGKAVLLDDRDPEFYFGVSLDPFADKYGHIPTARSLPMVWVWESDGTYRPLELVGEMAAGVAGTDKDQEIICYCGAGGYASGWWFLLTQALGYRDVKIYDGSMEAWANAAKPLNRYVWE